MARHVGFSNAQSLYRGGVAVEVDTFLNPRLTLHSAGGLAQGYCGRYSSRTGCHTMFALFQIVFRHC